MAIDPNVPGMAAVRFNSPFEVLGQMQDLKLRQQAIRSNQALEESRRQDIAKQARVEDINRRLNEAIATATSREQATENVRRMAPEALSAYMKTLDDHDKEAAGVALQVAQAAKASQDWSDGKLKDILENVPEGSQAGALRLHFDSLGKAFPAAKGYADHMISRLNQGESVETIIGKKTPPKAEPFTLAPGQTRFGPTGEPIANVPFAKSEPTTLDAAIFAARDNPQELNRLLEVKRKEAAAGRDGSNEPLVPIVGPDGKSVLVPRAQAIGKQPASTREQGRQVTAGEANDLSDFDTSLDELAAVRAAVVPGDSTGIVARIGAKIPYVTQITGWGSDAKKRQAVIARVKQVIGKNLEGGVLRKEDEIKYEDILPAIGDPQDVAIEKLNGLDAAIKKRKTRRLDALEDAQYDVTRFRQRGGAPDTGPAADAVEEWVRDPKTGRLVRKP